MKIALDYDGTYTVDPQFWEDFITLAKVRGHEVVCVTKRGPSNCGTDLHPEVPNRPEAIHLKEDEHFHSGKPKVYHIIVNGQQKTVTTKTVSYEEIVKLAFPDPITGPNIIYTVGYEDGPHHNPSGSLMPGGKVKVKDGMIFDVTPTDKS
jgi:hypothetical protein